MVAVCQFEEQLPKDLRLALEKNCAYLLTPKLVQGVRSLEVVDLQAPEPPKGMQDYRRVTLTPLPPPQPSLDRRQLQLVREQSRRVLGQPREVVERETEKRMRPGRTQESDTRRGVNQEVVREERVRVQYFDEA